jgi:hypothetical protein
MHDTRMITALRTIFHAQAREVREQLTGPAIASGKKVDLSHWHDSMADAMRPFLLEETKLGMAQGLRRLQRENREGEVDVRQLWRRMFADLEEQLDKVVRETIAAYSKRVNRKLRELRRALKRGDITQQESRAALTDHLYDDFVAGSRAERIDETEKWRALQAGRMLVMGEGGATTKTWKAKRGSCRRCRMLHGKTVPVDEPFYVDPEGGPYAVVDHSPMHPHCMCSTLYGGF